jgi:hypothetical protein
MKVHRDVQVPGREVGEPVRGHLVGHGERVAQVLGGQPARVLRLRQQRDRRRSGSRSAAAT